MYLSWMSKHRYGGGPMMLNMSIFMEKSIVLFRGHGVWNRLFISLLCVGGKRVKY